MIFISVWLSEIPQTRGRFAGDSGERKAYSSTALKSVVCQFAWPRLFKHGSDTIPTRPDILSAPLTAHPLLSAHRTMSNSWFSVPAGGRSESPSRFRSWRCRHSLGPSTSTTAGSSSEEEIIITFDEEEEQSPQQLPCLLMGAMVTDEEYQ